MNISSRCEYACRAVVELATHEHLDELLTATTIAERQSIPEKYLVHILLQLKRSGIIQSVRGAQGGYRLARSSDGITLLDVITSVDGPILNPLPASSDTSDELASAWKEVAEGVSVVLAGVNIRGILDNASKGDMYYI